MAGPPAWRFVNDHGVWWLVAPDGHRLLSRGVDCVGPGPDGPEFGTAKPTYAPALRGNEPYEPWKKRTLERLARWGFNTAAGWSDAGVGRDGLPFTPVLHIGIQLGMPWWDPWEADLPAKARAMADSFVAATRGHPNRIGYFLDNEFGWAQDWFLNIAFGWGSGSPGKHRLVETLRRVYRDDYRKFLEDFDCDAKNWDGLLTASVTGARPGRGARAVDAWMFEVAHQYNVVCAGAVRAADPGALILGDRYRQYYPQAVARAARGVLDAVSTNFEATTTDGWVSPSYFESLHELSGLPVMVGEFYATARQNRSGNRNHGDQFTLVDTQDERAAAAAAQARAFAAFPFVIGWHWFQWYDEPTYGRGDGEDYNMGLVDIQDRPYDEMAGALRAENLASIRIHAAAKAPGRPVLPVAVARQDRLVNDGRLGDWDKSSPVPRALVRTNEPVLPFGDFFLAWDGTALRLAIRVHEFTIPGRGPAVAMDPRTWGDLHRITVRLDDWTLHAATGLVHADGKPDDAGSQVTWAEPPASGQASAAVAAIMDPWRYTWEIAVPPEAVHVASFQPGRRFTLSVRVENRGGYQAMWLHEVGIELTDHRTASSEPGWEPVRRIHLDEPTLVLPQEPETVRADPAPAVAPGREGVQPVPPAPPSASPLPPAPASAPSAGKVRRAPRSPVARRPGAGPIPEKPHLPEKPATPEDKSPVPETKVVPGLPPPENPGQAKEKPGHRSGPGGKRDSATTLEE